MTIVDYSARLTKVQAAIDAILSGGHAAYTVDGQSVTKLDLAMLQKEEQRLIGLINRQAGRGGSFKTVVTR